MLNELLTLYVYFGVERYNMSDAKLNFDNVNLDGATLPLNLYWYGDKVGSFNLTQDGVDWQGYSDDKYRNMFVCREEDGAPQFLVNLHPDNAVFKMIGNGHQKEFISSGLRYLSNLSISSDACKCPGAQKDVLKGKLEDFTRDHEFIGNLSMDFKVESIEPDKLAKQVSKYWSNRGLSRFSGAEIKLPASLSEDGTLQTPSGDQEFTHLIKFPSTGGQEGWGVNEWMCLEISRRIGLETAEASLLKFDENLPPALVVERFDIPKSAEDDNNRYLIQDFCSLAGIDSVSGFDAMSGRTAGNMEEIGRTMSQYSKDPEQDYKTLIKRTLLSWVLGDNDMHRKNFSMLFEGASDEASFSQASLAPVYDVTSEVWRQPQEHNMVLPLSGKTKGLKEQSFVNLAKNYGIDEDDARGLIRETVETIAKEAVNIANNLPDIAQQSPEGLFNAGRIATFAVNMARRWGYETPEWSDVGLPKGQNGKSLSKTLASNSYNVEKLYEMSGL